MFTSYLDYVPAELRENKEWYIEFYAKDPSSGTLKRKRVKVNRVKSVSERRRYAKRMAHEINMKLAKGWSPFMEVSAPKSFYNIYDVFENFLNVKKKELREQSMNAYSSNINMIVNFLSVSDKEKQMYVAAFGKDTATEFLNHMYIDRNVGERRYNNILTFCNILFNWMNVYGYISFNPFEGLKKKREKTKARKVIPPYVRSDIEKLLNIEDKRFLTFLFLEFYALLRPNEILGLRVSDIDADRQVIKVREEVSKSNRMRLVTIPNVLLSFIRDLNLEKYKQDMFVFSQDMIPGYIQKTTRYARTRWEKLQRNLKLPDYFQMYSLRDSGIIYLLQSGVSVDEVAKQAGHNSLSITSRYALHANTKASIQLLNKPGSFSE
jgi:integrase